MNSSRIRQVKADMALLFVAFSWGLTFVVIKDALPICRICLSNRGPKIHRSRHGRLYNRAGSCSGAGNIGVFLKKPPGLFIIIGVTVATAGLGLLTLKGGSYSLNFGDILVFLCAISFASHIIAIGRYAKSYDPVLMAMLQIAVVALISFVVAINVETMPAHFSKPVWIGFIVCSIPATSLAYLIQNSVQRYTSPTHTAIIFTMEPVFSAITAHLLAREFLNWQQAVGCLLILAGMLIAEIKAAPAEPEKHPRNHQVST
jgi:drug/metabolite transporter (DMT)-like permease